MKQAKKHFNLIVSMALLLLAVVYLTNFTYSYFTTSHNAGGSVAFSDLDVQFYYKQTAESDAVTKEESSIELYSATGAIAIGSPFQLSLTAGGSAIDSLGFQTTTKSCESYIRFWIDAYVVNQDKSLDKTVNYGKYFLLNTNEAITNQNSSVANSSCYFVVEAFYYTKRYVDIGNTLTLTDLDNDPVPVEILGETIQITISFEAVQKANKAYLSAFGDIDDTKGYLKSWS